jgi:hypothetical protein
MGRISLDLLKKFFYKEGHTSYIVLLLVVLLLMVPYGFIIQNADEWHYYQIYSAIWVFRDWSYASGETYTSFGFPDPYAFLSSLTITCLRYVFAIQIIRHHRGETSQKKVWLSAILSLIPLAPLFILSLLGISMSAGGGFAGPIPLFLIIGLFIDRFWGIELPVQPWDDEKETELN